MIRLEHVAKRLGGKDVLVDVNLEVPEGQTCVVIGRSGTGKSVLLKHISGLFSADRGRIWIDGEEISAMRERHMARVRRKIGFLFQGAALFDSLTVGENVGFFLREQGGMSEREIAAAVALNLERVKLPGIEHVMPADLSGGMKKRVGLARALTMNPRIILYDEPTTGLDPITADAINDLIIEMRDQLGMTALAVTHDMASAFKIGDRIVMLHQGRVVFDDSVENTKRTENALVRQFVEGRASGPMTEDILTPDLLVRREGQGG
ncbi:ABC transporter ATP-binding protein [bacterium]|nr:ABC transporter ATP-binding protein [bacterium]